MVDLSIYLVTDGAQAAGRGHDITAVVEEAVAGGVTTVQVREKHAPAREVLALVETLVERLPGHVPVLVNDRVDVFCAARARGVGVAGVHIGQGDLPVEVVRELVGPDAIIGLTANTAAEIAAAEAADVRIDYVGIGVVRATSSKADAPEAIGVAGVGALARGTALPAVAIGGIVVDDVPGLRTEGLAGVAVVSWICAADNPRTAAEELTRAWAGSA